MCALRRTAAIDPRISIKEEKASTKIGRMADVLAFRQRGPDDERISELEPLPSSCSWPEYPSCEMVTQPREFQEAKGRGRTEKRAEPKRIPMRNGGGSIALTWAAAMSSLFDKLAQSG